MILIYVAILLVAFWKCGIRTNEAGDLALSKDQTTMIKGIFVLLVFASHISQYLDVSQSSDLMMRGYLTIRNRVGQLVVVPFLFYSGYGVRCAIKQKGNDYIRTFPKQRVLKTYIHSVLVILLFLLTQLIMGKQYSFGELFSGFLFWSSFGNSNWYIFVILLLYTFTWISFCCVRNYKWSVLICAMLTLLYYIVMCRLRESYWCNTVFVYCFGLAYSDLKYIHNRYHNNNTFKWVLCCTVFAFLTITLTVIRLTVIPKELQENLRAINAMTFINIFLQRIRLGNRLLRWLGTHVFECYLLQRLPMIVLSRLGVQQASILIFTVLCASITIVLASICKRVMQAVDNKVFNIT